MGILQKHFRLEASYNFSSKVIFAKVLSNYHESVLKIENHSKG